MYNSGDQRQAILEYGLLGIMGKTEQSPVLTVSQLALMLLFAAPLAPVNAMLAEAIFKPSPWFEVVPMVSKIAVVLLCVLQITVLYLMTQRLILHLRRSNRLYWLRLRLTTCIVLMLSASILLWLNVTPTLVIVYQAPEHQYGWPALHSGFNGDGAFWGYPQLTWNILVALFVLLVVSCISEHWLPRVLGRASDLNRESAHIAAGNGRANPPEDRPAADLPHQSGPVPPEATLRSCVPTLGERILYSVPMLLLGVLVAGSPFVARPVQEVLVSLKMEVSPIALFFGFWAFLFQQMPWSCICIWVGAILVYFGWISHDRKRMQLFNCIIVAILFVGLLGLCLAVILPFLEPLSSCIVAGTEIETPNGAKRIETLRVGDEVVTSSRAGGYETGFVTRISSDTARKHLRLELSDGWTLCVTREHPVATPEAWIRAGSLKTGDEVCCRDSVQSIASIVKALGPVDVFDITVQPNSNFFANEVLVHNALKKK